MDHLSKQHLSAEERAAAARAAEIAQRAEERAEQRAFEQALAQRREERQRREKQQQQHTNHDNASHGGGATAASTTTATASATSSAPTKVALYIPKRQREQQQQKQQESSNGTAAVATAAAVDHHQKKNKNVITDDASSSQRRQQQQQQSATGPPPPHHYTDDDHWTRKELAAVKETYLGSSSSQMISEEEQLRRQDKEAALLAQQKRKARQKSKKTTFKFRWDDTEDTFDTDDPLYNVAAGGSGNAGSASRRDDVRGGRDGGRGGHYGHGRHHQHQQQHYYEPPPQQKKRRKKDKFRDMMDGLSSTAAGAPGRGDGGRGRGGSGGGRRHDDNKDHRRSRDGGGGGDRRRDNNRHQQASLIDTLQSKPLAKMTARDWRIYRENYQINVKKGGAGSQHVPPHPMRRFDEPVLLMQQVDGGGGGDNRKTASSSSTTSTTQTIPTSLHPALLDAITNVLKYTQPSPIQRQAIPIGLQRQDLIGIAETGSGKTIAFGVPLCHYLLHLPSAKTSQRSVADDGPLAVVLAPTRELAIQIDVELNKLLSCQSVIKTCVIVGGQSIQQQAAVVRRGIHIVVGTPGRINECLDMAYLVLNQCCYCILDECDRMCDMGFLPQITSIMDAMQGGGGGDNKNKDGYEMELGDEPAAAVTQNVVPAPQQKPQQHRVTAMFSATMPVEVERIAQRYLRQPAMISIGDPESRANTRIEQRVIWVGTPAGKERALRECLSDRRFLREKIIVFVNEKKHADGVGRMVERVSGGRPVVVLHGGKSQDQREESMERFRRAAGMVLVATDVAGRGLDIPDVAHVINYDLPTRSIENYTHRIGRTGRAGKSGYATSFITEEDTGIMPQLKQYLESTNNVVPDRLARHPAVADAGGERNLII